MATALTTIGGWFAQATIQTLLDRLSSSAIEAYTLQSGLGDALSSLESSLLKVNSILLRSQKRHGEEDENLNKLLKRLKEAAYDAEDLIGELEYENLKLKMEREGDRSSGILPVALLKFTRGFLDDNTTKILKVREKLNNITADLRDVLQVLPNVGGRQQVENNRERLETSSFLTEPGVVGRDMERYELIDLLLNSEVGSRSNDTSIHVICVVGIGGVGKTTLAQSIYHDPRIEASFDRKIWICASDPFDVKRIIKELVGDSDIIRHEPANLGRLQEIFKRKIESRKFLVVIDDLWNENRSKWESFCAPLRFGAPGSKIVVTCRSRKVVETVGAKDIIDLKGLEYEPYSQFFKKCAFGYENSKNYPNLEAIGKKIAARLKGIPLAAKTLGRLLNSNLDEEHWTIVMESELWDLKQDEKDILPVLKLSYDYLAPCLKQCFAYCSLFPKDFEFDKDTLVQMWTAQGFITSQRRLMEDVGRGYVEDLLSMGLFQHVAVDDGKMMMHDLLHDLAQSISKDECYRIDYGKPQKIPRTIYHLSVCDPNLEPHMIMDICNRHKKLRTLLFVRGARRDLSVEELDLLLSGLTCMRVFVLERNCVTNELPGSIGNLKQLKYLDISGTNVQKLPESLCRLYNLQVLKLTLEHHISFPKGVTNLISLRHLSAKESSVSMIADIGRLTSLQDLRFFSIRKKHGHMIEELKNMIELRGIRIEHLENIDSKEEASKAKLDNKMYLKKLTLQWAYGRHTDLGIEVSDAVILEGLQPHSNLEILEIVNYGGLQCPSWLESQFLSKLVSIRLINCKRMVQLPPLGQLPCLKFLELVRLNAVKEVGKELYGTTQLRAFRSLKTLVFKDMPELGEWSGAYGSDLFPCLEEVVISCCPKLRNLPCLPPSLVSLELDEVGLDALPDRWVGFGCSYLSEVDIRNCPNLKSLEELLFTDHLLPFLETLSITDCGALTSLPIERFKYLSSLQSLTLRNCPKLTYADRPGEEQNNDLVLLFPSSLKDVQLVCCGDLDSALLLWLKGATYLRRLSMANCEHITSILPILPEEFGHDMTTLEYLRLEGLTELKTLEPLQCFTSLQKLLIKDCHQLKAMPEDNLPSSLKCLVISNCHPDLKERCQKDIGDDWPKIAHISNILIDGDVDYQACYFMSRSNNYWLGGRGLKKIIQYR